MTTLLEAFIATMQPFADWYGAAPRVQVGVSFLHFAGLLTSGGFAIAADRAVWRLGRAPADEDRARLLGELSHVHRPVLIGLSIVLLTGLVLTLADLEVYLGSGIYWSKMGLVALLLANGAVISYVGGQLAADPSKANRRWTLLLAASAASMTLWLTITLVGVILTNS